jgi:type VI secretion system protein ImpA
MAIDVDKLLAEIDAESPCGEDLVYDPAYLELERVLQGTPEQQVGSTIVQAEEPDWSEGRKQALALLERTKDLRVVVYLTQALTRTDGIPGVRDGLALLRGVLERYWDQIHPQLDPDDDYDPTERMNVLAAFAAPQEMQDTPVSFDLLLTATLCTSPVLHRSYSLRDIRVAKGELSPGETAAGQGPPDLVEIAAAFTGEKLNPDQQAELVESLQATARAAAEAAEHVGIIDSLLMQRVGSGSTIDFSGYQGLLREIGGCVNDYLGRVGAAVGAGSEPAAAPAGAEAGAPGGPGISGAVQSPEDVIRVLDRVCEYYERTEPSSPVPLLLRRAKKLVRKNFIEIIQDLTPDSLRQIQVISGPTEEPPQQY